MASWLEAALSVVTQKQSRAVLEALRDGPWRLVDVTNAGLTAVFSHVSSDIEHPMPEYIRPAMWPGETYRRTRTFSVTLHPDLTRIIYRQASTGVPWVGAQSRPLSNPKAVEFINEAVDEAA